MSLSTYWQPGTPRAFHFVSFSARKASICIFFIFCQVYKARDVGVNQVVLFPKVPDALKVRAFPRSRSVSRQVSTGLPA